MLNVMDKVRNNLSGSYELCNKKLMSKVNTLLIRERKSPTKTKPKYYLLGLNFNNKKAEYISSLYQLKSNLFKLDYQSKEYLLSFNGNSAIIKSIEL